MKVALITCGPSAAVNWSDDRGADYNRVVTVNWESHRFACDWVVSFDVKIWRQGNIIMPRVGAVSWGLIPDDVNRIRIENNLEWEQIDDPIELARSGRCSFTFPHAVRFCFDEWPECRLDIYGLDMSCDEGNAGHCSSRWARELPFAEAVLHAHWDRIRLVGCEFDPSIPRL